MVGSFRGTEKKLKKEEEEEDEDGTGVLV